MPRPRTTGSPLEIFDNIKRTIRRDPKADEISDMMLTLAERAFIQLSRFEINQLNTRIPNKSYFSFLNASMSSRPLNSLLFQNLAAIEHFILAVKANSLQSTLTSVEITSACYTLVVGFACVVDLTNPGDRQTPGTFFEYLILHLLSRHLDALPSERVRVNVGQDNISLTIDLLFDLVNSNKKLHIAIKNSTRERASEFWAHQRILNKAFVDHEYVGMFVGLGETKLDHNTYEVTEICVPDQWRAYQQYVATISRIYYLDPPVAYLRLNELPPYLVVRPFGDYFFDEALS